MRLPVFFLLIGEKLLPSQNKQRTKKKGEQAIWQPPFRFQWLTSSASPSPSVPQLLPQGLLLWPGLLRQHAGGEHGGEGRQDEVSGDPLAVLHPALPLHGLPGASGQVRRAPYKKGMCTKSIITHKYNTAWIIYLIFIYSFFTLSHFSWVELSFPFAPEPLHFSHQY